MCSALRPHYPRPHSSLCSLPSPAARMDQFKPSSSANLSGGAGGWHRLRSACKPQYTSITPLPLPLLPLLRLTAAAGRLSAPAQNRPRPQRAPAAPAAAAAALTPKAPLHPPSHRLRCRCSSLRRRRLARCRRGRRSACGSMRLRTARRRLRMVAKGKRSFR